ncbi:hypothetical protein F0562_018525 [Nyssa sinensis]|uniref:Cyclin-like domain-containing protein n=1 Tax=Nyssa sinensis TaxID=561372 RepID=A0A5J4Z9M9_9ASTE|nr:hypothetical protein F0562_018525 [Nyssa sinensis]
MVLCPHCRRNAPTFHDHNTGCVACTECGKVVYLDIFTEEPTFVKGSGGESRLAGTYVKSIQSHYSESHERTLAKGTKHIRSLVTQLDINGNFIVEQAACFYRIAVERSFTKGRRTDLVGAACLYIACRSNEKPYLLIDFSICLCINVYVLGAVFLQLCKLLSLEEHPIVQKPVDPSLFIHVFTSRLMGCQNFKVTSTALRIVASMKRDWMQTGRKPSGLCGAALYISALSHGFRYSKSDIVKVVHICEATLTRRLIEFENTESGSLTIEEFNKNAEDLEKENHLSKLSDFNSQKSGTMEVLCEHRDKEPHFAHGLCRSCYTDFIKLSGGLNGGSEPPAFQHAERVRLAKASAEVVQESSCVLKTHKDINSSENEVPFTKADQNVISNKKAELTESVSAPAVVGGQVTVDTFPQFKDISTAADETGNLSDIDDAEVNSYLNNEEESRYKKIIWEEMNKEYLQEQAVKEAVKLAAAAAAFKDVNVASDDLCAAQELAAAAAAAVAKSREERRQKRALEAKNASPAQNAAEATLQMLTKKRLSSKINYDALEKLFDENLDPDPKRNRLNSDDYSHTTRQKLSEEENEADSTINNDEPEQDDEDLEESQETVARGEYTFDNGEEVYDYDYDDHDGFDELI